MRFQAPEAPAFFSSKETIQNTTADTIVREASENSVLTSTKPTAYSGMLFLRPVNMAMVVMVGSPAMTVIISTMSWVIGSCGNAPVSAISSA